MKHSRLWPAQVALGAVALALVTACSGQSTVPSSSGLSPSVQSPQSVQAAQPVRAVSMQTAKTSVPFAHLFAAANTRRACTQAAPSGATCLALIRTDVGAGSGEQTASVTPPSEGYGPSDIQSAYGLPSSTAGSGQTVAIVDFFSDPKAASDLAAYRSAYGLPPCTTESGCLTIVNQRGQSSPLPPGDFDWAVEISLDLDMVSATCPNCHIVLVEGYNDNDAAENTAFALGANVTSNSWSSAETIANDPAFNHPGHVITASSGDDGYPYIGSPCTWATVVCVGGTTLVQDSSVTRGWAEAAWDGSGSGCSAVVPRPIWQDWDECGDYRAAADVSADADPDTPVAVYDSYGAGGYNWWLVGGTSVASPLTAGVFALAGNESSLRAASGIWDNLGTGLNNVTTGNNNVWRLCTKGLYRMCHAGKGYNGPTGWGTPNGISAY
jgi:subtilase family serine protease